jgi:hypothetical protein
MDSETFDRLIRVVASHGTRRAALGALLGAALLGTALLEPAAQARKKPGTRRRTGKPAGSKTDPGTDPTDPRSLAKQKPPEEPQEEIPVDAVPAEEPRKATKAKRRIAGEVAAEEVTAAAACRPPEQPCGRGGQCCTKQCRGGKCAPCPNGARFLPAPDLHCWMSWGSNGDANGKINLPVGVAVGGNGHVYVGDTFNDRIQVFNATGGFVRKWGSQGSGNGQFQGPLGVAVSGTGDVYVADQGNHRIQQFTATGGFIRT